MEKTRFVTEGSPKKILIAVDASEHSLEAVRYAGEILPVEGFEITLFHVLSPIPESLYDLASARGFERQFKGVYPWQAQQKKFLQSFMERARDLLINQGHPREAVSVSIQERKQGVARDIRTEAQRGYDALVLSRRGMSVTEGLFLGSVAQKLVGHLDRVNVWVTGGQPDPAKILIAIDGSEGAWRAIEYVGRIFGRTHPQLLLVHVTRGIDLQKPVDATVYPRGAWLEKLRGEFERAQEVMANILSDCVRYLEQQGADARRIETKIVPGVCSRAAAIFGEAQVESCGTIVVGRRGISRVEEFIMGRVSCKIIQLAREMSVWVIP